MTRFRTARANSLYENTHLSGTDSTIHVCSCDGVLRLVSRATGKEEGSFSVGDCATVAAHDDRLAHGSLHVNLPDTAYGAALLKADAFTGPPCSRKSAVGSRFKIRATAGTIAGCASVLTWSARPSRAGSVRRYRGVAYCP